LDEEKAALQQGPRRKARKSRVVAVLILSESSRIKLAKAEKTVGLQRSKTLDFLPGIGSPGKAGNNRPLEAVGSTPIGFTNDEGAGENRPLLF
jgi:hypothetical protein